VRARLSNDAWMEIIRERDDRSRLRAALFDFDGTLSLIREGWQDVMIPMMVEVLLETPRAESRKELEWVVKQFVTDLTGLQTIYQMIRLAEEVGKRGGTPRGPLEYKWEYLRRLDMRIADRIRGLEKGDRRPEEFLVPGAAVLLQALRDRGVVLYCASGTDELYCRHEADLLGLGAFFAGGVRGAIDDYKKFSKRKVIQSIIAEYALSGGELACAGDGFVEIEEGVAVGAHTVGVATREEVLLGGETKEPLVDEWKRERLIAAGADVIIPDFRHAARLVAYLFGE